ncbi:MAG: calcium/sodium antiporter [Pseudomonadota bacterium]
MEYLLLFSAIAFGLALLAFGGDWVVDGGEGLAKTLGVTPLVIGVVFLGFATSLPELFTSLQGALQGAPGVALGNVVGSNIANVLLIAGVASALAATRVRRTMIFRDGGFVFGTSLALVALLLTQTEIGFVAGAGLFATLIIYLIVALATEGARKARSERKLEERLAEARKARREGHPATALKIEEAARAGGADDDDDDEDAPALQGGQAFLWFGIGVGATIAGSYLLVYGAVELASQLGVSESLIGLTVVAFGTSLPELAAAIAAGVKGKPELAVGNVLGSNVFNVGAVVGVTAMVTPLATPPELLTFDVYAMLMATLLMLALAFHNRQLARWEGAVLLTTYVAYIAATSGVFGGA